MGWEKSGTALRPTSVFPSDNARRLAEARGEPDDREAAMNLSPGFRSVGSLVCSLDQKATGGSLYLSDLSSRSPFAASRESPRKIRLGRAPPPEVLSPFLRRAPDEPGLCRLDPGAARSPGNCAAPIDHVLGNISRWRAHASRTSSEEDHLILAGTWG
jgi:hypothetical protein